MAGSAMTGRMGVPDPDVVVGGITVENDHPDKGDPREIP